MKMVGLLAAAALALCSASASARTVDSDDNAAFLRDGRLFRFDYANDLFASRDRYFTQGYGFDYFHPALRKSPLMRLLPALPGESAYGLTFRHSGFTPTSLFSDASRVGDRPFASYLFLGHMRVSRDEQGGLTLTTELDGGIIGQGAGGKWIQVGLHRALGNLLPQGWDNQIRNDAVLNFHGSLEKRLVSTAWFDGGAFVDAAAGTLYTNAGVGLTGRLGAPAGGGKRAYLFARVDEKVVGYDATLQGGVFNRSSPYTLRAGQIERLVTRGDLGFALDRAGYAVVFMRSFQSREFKGGLAHQWGELSFIKRF